MEGQLLEIAASEVLWQKLLRDGSPGSFREASYTIEAKTLDQWRSVLSVIRLETERLIDQGGPDWLESEIDLPENWTTEPTRTLVREVVADIAQHEHYHVGQMITSLWAKGDNPYEW